MAKDRVIALIIAVIVAVLFGIIVKGINHNSITDSAKTTTVSSSNVIDNKNSVKDNDTKLVDKKSTDAKPSPQTDGNNKQTKTSDESKSAKENKGTDDEMHVLVAAEDIKNGDMIKAESLKWDLWPKKNVSDIHIAKDSKGNYVHPSLTMESLIGLSAKIDLPKNAPICKNFLLEGSADTNDKPLAISPGKRAACVPVDQMSVKNSVFSPNDFVDVYFDNRSKVMRNVRILALDSFTNSDEANTEGEKKYPDNKLPQTVTLELSLKKADFIMHNSKGPVYLTMVSNEEADNLGSQESTDDDSEYDADLKKDESDNDSSKEYGKEDATNSANESDNASSENDAGKESNSEEDKQNNSDSDSSDKDQKDQQQNDGNAAANASSNTDANQEQKEDKDDTQDEEEEVEAEKRKEILIIRGDKATLFDTDKIGIPTDKGQGGDGGGRGGYDD